MDRDEARYRVTAVLLQADGPRTLAELVAAAGVKRPAAIGALDELTGEGCVVEAEPHGQPAPQYCWAARRAKRRPKAPRPSRAEQLDIDSDVVLAFNDFILNRYAPPPEKRFAVFFQCSVRRPFSKSPSHASMRRAVSVATGHDPAREFDACPVHVVVLASRVGPVPYELEEFYPANVRGGGVKHFSPEHYARVGPVLAERMAAYITTHGRHYDHLAAFTQGRYGEVMAEAARIAGADVAIFPHPGGPTVIRMKGRPPRPYWERFWIQLYLEIVSWLPADQRPAAEARLRELEVEYA